MGQIEAAEKIQELYLTDDEKRRQRVRDVYEAINWARWYGFEGFDMARYVVIVLEEGEPDASLPQV